jgi:hypothetical protein
MQAAQKVARPCVGSPIERVTLRSGAPGVMRSCQMVAPEISARAYEAHAPGANGHPFGPGEMPYEPSRQSPICREGEG